MLLSTAKTYTARKPESAYWARLPRKISLLLATFAVTMKRRSGTPIRITTTKLKMAPSMFKSAVLLFSFDKHEDRIDPFRTSQVRDEQMPNELRRFTDCYLERQAPSRRMRN